MEENDENRTLLKNSSCEMNGTCYKLNASEYLGPLDLVEPIYGFIVPVLILITLISNTLIIIVLSRKQMKSPTNIVLLGMAVCDLLTVIFPVPWYIYLYTYNNHGSVEWTAFRCYMFELMMETLPQIFHTSTNWLTLALAVQRYVYVCQAAIAKQCCTNFRSQVLVLSIVGVSFLHMTTRLIDRGYSVEYLGDDDVTSSVCTVHFSNWLQKITLDVYFLSFFWFRVVFVQLIPCISLVILNTFLFSAMKRAERRRQKLLERKSRVTSVTNTVSEPCGRENKRQRDANSTTLMLIIVIAVFLIVEIPLMVITALHTISSSLYEFMNYEVVKKIMLLMNVALCISYPVNFGIYCGMSRQFRDTFKMLIITPLMRLITGAEEKTMPATAEATNIHRRVLPRKPGNLEIQTTQV